MSKKDHPFFCYKKNCRKTAWDTPNYLNKEDWENLNKIIQVIEDKDYYFLWYFTTTNKGAEDFFNRVIGWPEGYNYCFNLSFCEKTAIHGLYKHELPKMKKALKEYKKLLT